MHRCTVLDMEKRTQSVARERYTGSSVMLRLVKKPTLSILHGFDK